MHQARILHISIAVPFDEAYGYAHRPENFGRWAAGLATSLHYTPEGWLADTPDGAAKVHFSERNDFGVLDHRVELASGVVIAMPMRMVANGDDATEVEIILYRLPEMNDADYDRDVGLIEADLASLKALLERNRRT